MDLLSICMSSSEEEVFRSFAHFPALAGGFFTVEPPGKPQSILLLRIISLRLLYIINLEGKEMLGFKGKSSEMCLIDLSDFFSAK